MNLLHLCLAYCIILTGVRGDCPVRNGEVSVGSIPATLSSPDYNTGSYPSNVLCRWTLRAIQAPYRVKVQVLDMDLESETSCEYDYLEIKDTYNSVLGKLCGSTRGTYRSSGRTLFLTFKTDNSVEKGGFRIQFSLDRAVAEVTTTATVNPVIDSCPSGNGQTFTASYSYAVIRSMGYPSRYPDTSYCTWNLRAASVGYVVKLEVDDIDMESSSSCSYDSLSAYNGYSQTSSSSLIRRWCGSTAPTVFSTGRYMTLVFQTDDSVGGRGFQIRFTQVPEGEAASSTSTGVTIGVVSAVVFIVFIVVVCIGCLIRARLASARRSSVQRAQRAHVTSAGVAATSASRHLGFTGGRGALYNRQASSVSLPQPLDPPSFAPPPYPGGPDPSTLPKDDPPPYWMAAMYTVDPGAQHLPKPEGHVPADVTSGPAPPAAPAPTDPASAPPPPPANPPPPVPPAYATGSVDPSAPYPSGGGYEDLTASGVARGGAAVAPSGGNVGRDNRGYTHDDEV